MRWVLAVALAALCGCQTPPAPAPAHPSWQLMVGESGAVRFDTATGETHILRGGFWFPVKELDESVPLPLDATEN